MHNHNNNTLKSCEALKAISLVGNDVISEHFINLKIYSFYDAMYYVWRLPYISNSSRTNPLIILEEKHGTCSTKHALIYELAKKYNVSMQLCMALFMMNKNNAPKIALVLERFKLSEIPQMHCYIRYKREIIDITFFGNRENYTLINEECITTGCLGDYKTKKHKEFITNWLLENPEIKYNNEEIFNIRELCIQALGN